MPPIISQQLKEAMADLPFVSSGLPGVGGALKAAAEHFQVQEVLPYEPCGAGEHLFIKLRRQGWNTHDVGRAIGKSLKAKAADIGWGGRKDKNAVTTQTFSVRLPLNSPLNEIEASLADLPFEILDLKRHGNKLKTGHVAANRFRILLSRTAPHAQDAARAIADCIQSRGLPNYYGEQRFGGDMRNLDRAAHVLERGRASKNDRFILSSLQSALFNLWLKQRMDRDAFNTIIEGDIVKKTDTGGMFVVEDLAEALQRFEKRRIVYTGPIYGYKMKTAGSQAQTHERGLLASFGLALEDFKALKAPGSRRTGIIYVDDLSLESVEGGLLFAFTLPSGAYATTLMREFMRTPAMTAP